MLKFHLILKNSKYIYKNKLLLAPLPQRSLNKQRNIFKTATTFLSPHWHQYALKLATLKAESFTGLCLVKR